MFEVMHVNGPMHGRVEERDAFDLISRFGYGGCGEQGHYVLEVCNDGPYKYRYVYEG